MAARAGFHALAVGAALVMASGAMSDDAMAQADEAAVESTEAAAQADETAARDDSQEQPLPMQKPAIADRPAKADLDQSAVAAAPVTRTPRPTRTSTIALPKILGSYR